MPNLTTALFNLPINDYLLHIKTNLSNTEVRALAATVYEHTPSGRLQAYIDDARSEALRRLIQWGKNNLSYKYDFKELENKCANKDWKTQEKILLSAIGECIHISQAILLDFLSQVGEISSRPTLQQSFLTYMHILAHCPEIGKAVLEAREGKLCGPTEDNGENHPYRNTMYGIGATLTQSLFNIDLLTVTTWIERLTEGDDCFDPGTIDFNLINVSRQQMIQNQNFMKALSALLKACQTPKNNEQKSLARCQIQGLANILIRLGMQHPLYKEAADIFWEKSQDVTLPEHQQQQFLRALQGIFHSHLSYQKEEPSEWAKTLMKQMVLSISNLSNDDESILYYFLKTALTEPWFIESLQKRIKNITIEDIDYQRIDYLAVNSDLTSHPAYIELMKSMFPAILKIHGQYMRGEIRNEQYPTLGYNRCPGYILKRISSMPGEIYSQSWFHKGLTDFFHNLNIRLVEDQWDFRFYLQKLLKRAPISLLYQAPFPVLIKQLLKGVLNTNSALRTRSEYLSTVLPLLIRQDIDPVLKALEYDKTNLISSIKNQIHEGQTQTHTGSQYVCYNNELIMMLTSQELPWINLALEMTLIPAHSPFASSAVEKLSLPWRDCVIQVLHHLTSLRVDETRKINIEKRHMLDNMKRYLETESRDDEFNDIDQQTRLLAIIQGITTFGAKTWTPSYSCFSSVSEAADLTQEYKLQLSTYQIAPATQTTIASMELQKTLLTGDMVQMRALLTALATEEVQAAPSAFMVDN